MIPYATVEMPSTFPVPRRPVYYISTANVTHKTMEEAVPKLQSRIGELCDVYSDERILVHTVSKDLTLNLLSAVPAKRAVTYLSSTDRDGALAEYRGKRGAVLLAMSFDRGIDLPYDECRVVLMPKCPYPDLGDKQVSAAFHAPGGALWYKSQCVMTIVQMAGRGMRAANDRCDCWILDAQFYRLWNRSQGLFPMWFRQAVRFDGTQKLEELKGGE